MGLTLCPTANPLPRWSRVWSPACASGWTACAGWSPSCSSAPQLPALPAPVRRRGLRLPVFQCCAALGVVPMPAVPAGHGELTELVSDHRLGDEHRDVLASVVDGDGVADHVGEDVAATRPGLDDLLLARLVQDLHLLEQVLVAERAFLEGTTHALLLAPPHDHAVGGLVVAGAMAQRRLAPWRLRIATCTASALPPAVGVVEGVHGHAAHRGAEAAPAHLARLAPVLVLVVDVADLADGRAAAHVDAAHLAAGHAQRRVLAFAGQQLGAGAGAAHQLATLAQGQLDVVDGRAKRDLLQRHRVARTDLGVGAGHDRVADAQPERGEDVALLAVAVVDQGDARRAVGVVLDGGDLAGHVELVALEVDDPVQLLVAAAAMADGHPAVDVA